MNGLASRVFQHQPGGVFDLPERGVEQAEAGVHIFVQAQGERAGDSAQGRKRVPQGEIQAPFAVHDFPSMGADGRKVCFHGGNDGGCGRKSGRHSGQGVNLALHILNGLLDLRHGESVHAGHSEMRVHLRPGGGVVNRGHAYPGVDDGCEGFALRVGAAREGGRSGRLRLGLIPARLADGGHNLRSNPVREGISFGLVRTERQLVHGWFGDGSKLLISRRGEETPQPLPLSRNCRQNTAIPFDGQGFADITGGKPKRFTFNLCTNRVVLKGEGRNGGHFGKKFGLRHGKAPCEFRLAFAEIAKAGSSKAHKNAQAYSPCGYCISLLPTCHSRIIAHFGQRKSLDFRERHRLVRSFRGSVQTPRHRIREMSSAGGAL
nr:MAG TPA: hypothetical protein [Caudoviricetes sp.]